MNILDKIPKFTLRCPGAPSAHLSCTRTNTVAVVLRVRSKDPQGSSRGFQVVTIIMIDSKPNGHTFVPLAVYKWNQMDLYRFIWFHLYTVKVMEVEI